MSDDVLVVILPIALITGNLILVFLIISRVTTVPGRVGWLTALVTLTVAAWFSAALPYGIGLAGSAASCLKQVGDPGCRRFEEFSALFSHTLGNFSLLLLLCAFDVLIVLLGSYLAQRPRGTRLSFGK